MCPRIFSFFTTSSVRSTSCIFVCSDTLVITFSTLIQNSLSLEGLESACDDMRFSKREERSWSSLCQERMLLHIESFRSSLPLHLIDSRQHSVDYWSILAPGKKLLFDLFSVLLIAAGVDVRDDTSNLSMHMFTEVDIWDFDFFLAIP